MSTSGISDGELLDWLLNNLTVGELDGILAREFDPEYEYLNELFPEEVKFKQALLSRLKKLFPRSIKSSLPNNLKDKL